MQRASLGRLEHGGQQGATVKVKGILGPDMFFFGEGILLLREVKEKPGHGTRKRRLQELSECTFTPMAPLWKAGA